MDPNHIHNVTQNVLKDVKHPLKKYLKTTVLRGHFSSLFSNIELGKGIHIPELVSNRPLLCLSLFYMQSPRKGGRHIAQGHSVRT